MLLHAWRQFCHLVTLFGVRTNSLLSFVFVLFTHHSKFGNEDSPGHNSRPELIQHVRVNLVVQVDRISHLLLIPFVKRERSLGLLGLSHGSLPDFLSSRLIFGQDLLVEGLQGGPRNVVCLEFVLQNFRGLLFFASRLSLQPFLANSFGLFWALHKIEGRRHCHIVLAFAAL